MKSTFSELDFDYLDVAELVINIENKLNTDFNGDMFYTRTVGELIVTIEELNIEKQIY